MEELKSCPFCGGSSRISYGSHEGELYVIAMCSSCGIRTPNFYYSSNHVKSELHDAEMMVAKRWNRRVETTQEESEINPCRGCEDYDGKGGCKSNGGCGAKMDEKENFYD